MVLAHQSGVNTRADGSNFGVQDLNNPTTQVFDFGHRNLDPGNGAIRVVTIHAAGILHKFHHPSPEYEAIYH